VYSPLNESLVSVGQSPLGTEEGSVDSRNVSSPAGSSKHNRSSIMSMSSAAASVASASTQATKSGRGSANTSTARSQQQRGNVSGISELDITRGGVSVNDSQFDADISNAEGPDGSVFISGTNSRNSSAMKPPRSASKAGASLSVNRSNVSSKGAPASPAATAAPENAADQSLDLSASGGGISISNSASGGRRSAGSSSLMNSARRSSNNSSSNDAAGLGSVPNSADPNRRRVSFNDINMSPIAGSASEAGSVGRSGRSSLLQSSASPNKSRSAERSRASSVGRDSASKLQSSYSRNTSRSSAASSSSSSKQEQEQDEEQEDFYEDNNDQGEGAYDDEPEVEEEEDENISRMLGSTGSTPRSQNSSRAATSASRVDSASRGASFMSSGKKTPETNASRRSALSGGTSGRSSIMSSGGASRRSMISTPGSNDFVRGARLADDSYDGISIRDDEVSTDSEGGVDSSRVETPAAAGAGAHGKNRKNNLSLNDTAITAEEGNSFIDNSFLYTIDSDNKKYTEGRKQVKTAKIVGLGRGVGAGKGKGRANLKNKLYSSDEEDEHGLHGTLTLLYFYLYLL
jgi:hypothetical protein